MVTSDWLHIHTRQGRRHMTWEQWHVYYSSTRDLFTLYLNLPGGEVLAANWQEAGVHSRTSPGRPDYPLVTGCPIQVGGRGTQQDIPGGTRLPSGHWLPHAGIKQGYSAEHPRADQTTLWSLAARYKAGVHSRTSPARPDFHLVTGCPMQV